MNETAPSPSAAPNNSGSAPLLSVQNLKVTFGGVVAVRDVSFDVGHHETVVMLGANGAGKTSTLRAISGLVPRAGGTVTYLERDLEGLAPEAIAAQRVAHVPDHRGIFPTMTVAENLRMGLYGAGREGTAEGNDAVTHALRTFPILDERQSQPAGTMSGGQQQQLAIARALVQDPQLLMIDEMSMGLAPAIVEELFAIIARLALSGMSILMVEQFVGPALAIADRAVVLEQGRVVASGTPDQLAGDDLAAAYLGEESSTTGRLGVGPPAGIGEEVNLTLPPGEIRRLERLARERGTTVQAVVAELAGALLDGDGDGSR